MNIKATLVIDAQIGLITGAYREQAVIDAINLSISKVRESHGIVIFIQHCHSTFEPMKKGNEGWKLHPSLDTQSDDLIIEKEASDSFYETDLDILLQQKGVGHLYITGLQTEYCVDATCRAALSKGYDVTLVSDAHTTGDSHLSAKEVIEHHNKILGLLVHPKRQILVQSSEEI